MQIVVKPMGVHPVLREDDTFFAEQIWVEVENTHYIRRRIAAGDLMVRPSISETKAVAVRRKDKEGKANG